MTAAVVSPTAAPADSTRVEHAATVVAVVAVHGQRRPVRVTCANVQQAAAQFFGGAPTVCASAIAPVSAME